MPKHTILVEWHDGDEVTCNILLETNSRDSALELYLNLTCPYVLEKLSEEYKKGGLNTDG